MFFLKYLIQGNQGQVGESGSRGERGSPVSMLRREKKNSYEVHSASKYTFCYSGMALLIGHCMSVYIDVILLL